jgi:hypothetical protein
LRTAELAATMMLDIFWKELSWEQLSAEYARHWKREFLPRLRWGRGLEALLLRPRLAWLSSTALYYLPWLMEQLYRRTRRLFPLPSSPMEAVAQRRQ